jgi:co-chaperonin GroES (HSP10)
MGEATQARDTTALLRPTSTRIIVKEDPFKYGGRIIVPDNVQRRPTTGVIIAVGEAVGKWVGEEGGASEFIPTFHVGERVVYGLYSGTVINFKNSPALRCLTEDEVLGWVLTDEELEGVGT